MDVLYLDNNATTQPLPEVVEAMAEVQRSGWANPSSVHRFGQAARQRIELARESVCGHRLAERELVFTSGGTESANLAITGSLQARRERRVLVTSRIEHSAVRQTVERLADAGVEVVWLECDPHGRVDCNQLEAVLQRQADRVALVSVMWANNETGVVQPLETVGALCRTHGVRLHTDATQWVGKMPVDVADMPVDLMTFAAHKFHGPMGAGALYVRRGVRVPGQMHGGPQERQRRGGTENVPAIVGMGAAADSARAWLTTDGRRRQGELRDRMERGVLEAAGDAVVNGAGAERIWNTSNIAFPRLEAEAILLLLSERGLCASAGSACSSGSLDPSPVLLAMGVPDAVAHGSVRFSLSRFTTGPEIDRAVEIIARSVSKLRQSAISH